MAVNNRSAKPKTVARTVKAVPASAKSHPSADLDRLIHERVRLALVSALAANAKLNFNDLKALLKISDGNLSAHARKLEEAGYISCIKGYEGRIPRTEYKLLAKGRDALKNYIAHMEALISAMKKL
jgi:DNA-binding HxlR family transcriptional regulator